MVPLSLSITLATSHRLINHRMISLIYYYTQLARRPRPRRHNHRWEHLRRSHNVRMAAYWRPGKLQLASLWPWPLTLKTFSAMLTHMANICAEFHWNLPSKWSGIAPRETGVNGRPDRRPENVMLRLYHCWPRYWNLNGRNVVVGDKLSPTYYVEDIQLQKCDSQRWPGMRSMWGDFE